MEMIVVDDNSTDGTSFVARAYGAKALCLNHLPDGWKGKPNACHRGAEAAQGQWLLFTDADTVHTARQRRGRPLTTPSATGSTASASS